MAISLEPGAALQGRGQGRSGLVRIGPGSGGCRRRLRGSRIRGGPIQSTRRRAAWWMWVGTSCTLLCMGEGSPTVLLDAWSGGWSAEWEPIQATLALSTRVCAWDRAGSGWSDLGTHNHTRRRTPTRCVPAAAQPTSPARTCWWPGARGHGRFARPVYGQNRFRRPPGRTVRREAFSSDEAFIAIVTGEYADRP